MGVLLAIVGTSCTLSSSYVLEEITPAPPKIAPAAPDVTPDPDMVVIGQPSWLTTNTNNSYNPLPTNLSWPISVTKIGNKYFVSDYGNHRILIFENSISGTPTLVLGQPDFNSGIGNNDGGLHRVSARGLYFPTQIATNGNQLVVADASNNRVLIWNSIPTSSFQPADIVLGQVNFQQSLPNQGINMPSASSLYGPAGVIFVGPKLIISDRLNHRLLVYNSIPTSNGASADLVIGQADFNSNSSNRNGGPPSSMSFHTPRYLSTDGTKLVVADCSNNRVLIWNTVPTALDIGANVVLGQTSFTANTAATSQSGLRNPRHGLIVGTSLYIADRDNNRIVYHAEIPSAPGAAASSVIGQPTFTSNTANRGLTAPTVGSLKKPMTLAHFDGNLWVADNENSRLLKYSPLPAPANISEGAAVVANEVWGQQTMTSGHPNQVISPNKNGFGRISGVCAYDKWIIAADPANERFMVFDRSDISQGAIAVIGQMDFNSNQANQGAQSPAANTLSINASGLDPACAFDSRGRLYISDNNNNRVLVWNQIPLSSGAHADFVFGQTAFSIPTAQGCSATGLSKPTGVTVVNDRLVVNDYGYHRSLIFDVSTTELDRTADLVIGAPNLTSCAGGTSSTLSKTPWSTVWDGSRLYIVEYGNNRIMVYNSFPSANGVSADFVIGQPDFTSVLSGVSANRFLKGSAGGIRATPTVYDGFLISSDYYNQRVIAFDLTQISNGMDATYVFSQPDMNTGIATTRPGNLSNTAFDQFWLAMGIHNFPDDGFIWISDQIRLIRVKKDKLFKYAL
jgi:hypothetical protein